ncbi:DUF2442 domain-containing protein [uncultured Algoriphagus sp.]|uniref:DUF2442 domain-containing protein n=1 Tax=uncultured Algoriphagus sp. TaxID=417365 RepID=UPI002583AE41|nr:DUF2442 domain-containing protein [uncultured Algoriphagus sp.]
MKITEKYLSDEKPDLLEIQEAKYVGDFAIRLIFNDGHKVLVDFKPFLEESKHPSIQKYLDENLFKGFQIKEGNLDWNDFDLCFPIKDLYNNTVSKKTVEI